jgi:hypothetical protein
MQPGIPVISSPHSFTSSIMMRYFQADSYLMPTTRFVCCRESGLAAREQQVQQQASKHGQLEQLLSALWKHLQELLPGNTIQVCN